VKTLVIDASVAVKWVVEEEGTAEALALLRASKRSRASGSRMCQHFVEEGAMKRAYESGSLFRRQSS
jgi:predicted nucleic acid-binding protein